MTALTGAQCGTATAFGTRGTIRSKPSIAAPLIVTGMVLGWIATGIITYEIGDAALDDGYTYLRPKLFVPLAVATDLSASIGVLLQVL